MRRGLIAIGGDVGDFVGVGMLAGTVVLFGNVGLRPGAGMKRGSCVVTAPAADLTLLPTFKLDCTYRPFWVRICLLQLRQSGVKVPEAAVGALYRRYSGDFVETGKGEILVCASP